MKHPIRKALTAILVMTLPFCGGLVPSIPMRVSAAGGSASDIYANSISSIPLSDAAARMAAAPVGGTPSLLPVTGGKTVNVADFGANGGDRSSDTEAIRKAIESLGGAGTDRKSTRLNSSHSGESRMPSSA